VKNPANGGGASSIDRLLAAATKDVERKRYGSADGDPNGDSEVGEGDPYGQLVHRAISTNYQVPSTISERERLFLKADVRVWIEPDGVVSNWKIVKPSGNAVFDDALERAIRAARLPPPPPDERSMYQSRGRTLTFTAAKE
jgi:colicin import membrane protein/protein TonB